MKWVLARLAEPSTHAGIAGLATGLAMLMPPGSAYQQVASAVAMVFGGVAAVKAG